MKIRRIAAVAAVSAMALSVMAANAYAYEHTAFLMFTDGSWLWGNWNAGEGTDAVITGPGTYTVSLDNTQAENADEATNGANVFCVDIIEGYADLAEMDVTLDSIRADGAEVRFDPEKICYGDIEEKGNFRIEIQNAYGLTGKATDEHYGAIDAEGFSAAEKIEVTFTISDPKAVVTEATTVVTTEATTPAPIEEVIAEDGTPNGDVDSKVSPTGNSSAAGLAGVMLVAAVSALAVKKRK